ncbi:hypothetical protein GCM10010216_10970 [Streptomyces flaveolus]|nr:hypothetical protein GCM10010216_10970 [Streptomyces flaveolus]
MLGPGGVLVGADSGPSRSLYAFHEGDVRDPVEPAALLVRLRTRGCADITLGVGGRLTFSAHEPPSQADQAA